MPAGKLRERVTLQRRVITQNDFGEEVVTWQDVATVWAAVEPLSGREIVQQQRAEALITHRVVIRHRADVAPTMRVLARGRKLQIEAVLESGKRDWLTLMCTEVVGG